MAENSMTDLRNYFNVPEKPCSMAEFSEFWKSLSEEDKAEYKAADLSK